LIANQALRAMGSLAAISMADLSSEVITSKIVWQVLI
jgi:hypothetical protein